MIFIGARKFHFPYTIALVAIGILLGVLVHYVPALSFLTTFELSKDTLLYVFLPVLLFESAYNIRYRELIQHKYAIGLLAIVALIISAVLSATILYYWLGFMGIAVPFLVLLLFGSLISATDPVSVLALFKEVGAPRRLTLIFEGESLFNDGTALALFLVVLSILHPSDNEHSSIFSGLMHSMHIDPILSGLFAFALMIIMGFVLGGTIGYLASRSIPFLRKAKMLEITLTLIIAHATFLFAEWVNHMLVPVSAVITTTIAALVMGNYGRYKLSTETRHIMGEYWEFFAFIVNSLVFLLVGIMIVGLNIHFSELIIPIILAIISVAAARAISVYGVLLPLNLTKKEYTVPFSWMHLLSWGSLRGGLSIIMAILIPADFVISGWPLETSVRDFVLGITVGCIIFTTFIKATSISAVMKKLHISDPSLIEKMDYEQGRILYLFKLQSKIHAVMRRGYMTEAQKASLLKKYESEILRARESFQKMSQKAPEEMEEILSRTLALHALEIEKSILLEIFAHNEIPEKLLGMMLNKFEAQIERVEDGKSQIKELYAHKK